MSAARESVLLEAEQWAVRLRREGYTDVEVVPEYCIGNVIDDGFFTRTVCISVGPCGGPHLGIVARVKAWWNA